VTAVARRAIVIGMVMVPSVRAGAEFAGFERAGYGRA
jgi:hypothetical protein